MFNYKELAELLINAEEDQYPVSSITNKMAGFNLSMGYIVQDELVKIKKNQGYHILAFKMGLTSEAKMKQMNINEPIYGFVFDYMRVQNEGYITKEELIHPKVEAEIAFIIGEDIEGPAVTGEEVLSKTEGILPALEIIDSRFKDFKFKLPDVVADNTSAARVVFGEKILHSNEIDLEETAVALSVNRKLKASGTGAAVLGNPANSVAMLAKMLFNQGKGKIPKGSIVLTGGMTEAVMLTKGDHITARYDQMGEISFSVR